MAPQLQYGARASHTCNDSDMSATQVLSKLRSYGTLWPTVRRMCILQRGVATRCPSSAVGSRGSSPGPAHVLISYDPASFASGNPAWRLAQTRLARSQHRRCRSHVVLLVRRERALPLGLRPQTATTSVHPQIPRGAPRTGATGRPELPHLSRSVSPRRGFQDHRARSRLHNLALGPKG